MRLRACAVLRDGLGDWTGRRLGANAHRNANLESDVIDAFENGPAGAVCEQGIRSAKMKV